MFIRQRFKLINLLLGPVFVEFPIDTLYPYPIVKKEVGMKESGPQSLMQKIVNWYDQMHCNTSNFQIGLIQVFSDVDLFLPRA